jgi:hypothetical protein
MSDGMFGDLDLESAQDDPFAIPDNSYVAYLTDVRVGPTKNGDKVGMTMEYTIDEGPHSSKKISEWKQIPQPVDPKNLTDEEMRAMSFIKQRMLSLGVPAEKINEVKPDDLIGTKVVVAVKNKGGYTNVRSIQVVDPQFSGDNIAFE